MRRMTVGFLAIVLGLAACSSPVKGTAADATSDLAEDRAGDATVAPFDIVPETTGEPSGEGLPDLAADESGASPEVAEEAQAVPELPGDRSAGSTGAAGAGSVRSRWLGSPSPRNRPDAGVDRPRASAASTMAPAV